MREGEGQIRGDQELKEDEAETDCLWGKKMLPNQAKATSAQLPVSLNNPWTWEAEPTDMLSGGRNME